MRQIGQMEDMQRNQVGEVQNISGEEARDEGPAMSAQERPQVLADARARSDQALQDRGRAEAVAAEARSMQGERAMAGMHARSNAIYAGKTDSEASRLQREAEQRYDLQKQQEQNLRAAS